MRHMFSGVKVLFLFAAVTLVVSGNVFAQGTAEDPTQDPCKTGVSEKKEGKCNEFLFDGTSSYDPNNKKISYLWDFGDGTTSTERVVKHVYDKSGAYTVTLTVTNNTGVKCDTAVSTQKVVVNLPPAAQFAAPEKVCADDSVTFDASATTDDTPGELSYAWDLGDGTKETGKVVSHTYKKSGAYRVRLTVDDNAKSACSTDTVVKTIVVNSAPVADAGKDKELCFSAAEDFRVTFDGSASSDPDRDTLTYDWNFGDGETGTGAQVSHAYAKGGTYTVRLTVRDNSGASCSTASDEATVSLFKGPSADAGEDVSVCLGEEVAFSGIGASGSDSGSLNYRWDFGDGTNAEGANVKHVYMKGGTYKAILTVDDGTGSRCSTASDVKTVTVGAPPVADLADVTPGCVGDRVSLDASGSTSPEGGSLKYTWDFGDGVVQEGGSKVTHVYEKGGQYNVKVSVQRTAGSACKPVEVPCSTDMASTTVRINTPPVADAGPNFICCAGKENILDGSFSADADGDALTYMWDFGDGQKAEGKKVEHTYTKAGTYKVVLTVDDNSGTKCSKSSDGFVATVLEQPVSVIKVK